MRRLIPGMLVVAFLLLTGCDATTSVSGKSPLPPWPDYNNHNGSS
jgi:hypothetical protein